MSQPPALLHSMANLANVPPVNVAGPIITIITVTNYYNPLLSISDCRSMHSMQY